MLSSTRRRFSLFAGEYDEEEDQEVAFPTWAWILMVPFALILFIWWWMGRRPKQVEIEYPLRQQEETYPAIQKTTEPAATSLEPSTRQEPQKKAVEVPKSETKARKVQAKADNLQRIDGIGPKISNVFREAGILTFEDLAASDVEQLQKILEESGIRIADPGTWPEQARYAAAGDWQGLEEFQSKLKGGRKVE
jgi:predicted flap endonuclease-1-like 5' DNA nuclease